MEDHSANSSAVKLPASKSQGDQHANTTHSAEAIPGSHSAVGVPLENPGEDSASGGDLAGTVRALTEKIAGLERQVHDGKESTGLPPPHQHSTPRMREEMLEYHRRERYLYKHRKDWTRQTYGPISLYEKIRKDDNSHSAHDPVWLNLNWKEGQEYRRPDPFLISEGEQDPEVHTDENLVSSDEDEFDRQVDYSNRRDRLRKTYEWELDRLWLAEETELRRQKKKDEAKREKEREERKKADALKAAAREQISGSADLGAPNRVEWSTFKAMAGSSERYSHVIDILLGDPIIDSGNKAMRWQDYLLRGRKLPAAKMNTTTQSTATLPLGHAQLPERIRINSVPLLTIMGTIMSASLVSSDGSGVILFRPFKTLTYCESALREWCQTLEAKLLEAKSGEDAVGNTLRPETDDAAASTAATVAESSNPEGKDINNDMFETGTANVPDHPIEETSATPADERIEEEKVQTNPVSHSSPAQKYSNNNQTVDEGKENHSNDITQSDTALLHLKCLLKFIDTDLNSRRNRILETTCQKVFFSDLWHLFRPGMGVIGKDGKQAYRVVNVTTAKHGTTFEDDYQAWFDGPIGGYGHRRNKKGKKDEDDDDEDDSRRAADFEMTCIYIDFDGERLGPVAKDFPIKRYNGEKDISSLPVYPLRFHPAAASRSDFAGDADWRRHEEDPASSDWLRRKLIRRGTKFLEVVGVKHMYYSGPTLDVDSEEVESQVVVDFQTAISAAESKDVIQKPDLDVLAVTDLFNYNTDSVGCSTCCADEVTYEDGIVDEKQTREYIEGLLPKQGEQQAPPVAIVPRLLKDLQTSGHTVSPSVSEDELLIMSYRVFGFVLRSLRWATLDLDYLTDVQSLGESQSDSAGGGRTEWQEKMEKSSNAFDRLVLPDGHKDMIKSLIAQHYRDKESKGAQSEQFDIVRGKGKGLIMLLHGAPGVGKTSTAEGVAELFQKPLYHITCGDLGITARDVEKALNIHFALASRWGCILLLDEADVFLAERTKEDFKRNGLVAVFLRVLEYYAGILFLTTNRVGDFDEAFTSRIHISLHYPMLTQVNTREVFRINLTLIKERFTRQGRQVQIDELGVGGFADRHFTEHSDARWNGRQIRNACQTALALAEFEAQGNSHETILRPDAVVRLTEKHFDTVRKAYLEFTKYMTEVYGTSAARRAKEGRLRAMDGREGVVGAEVGDHFARAVQTPLRGGSSAREQPSHHSPFDHSPQRQPGPSRQGYPQKQQQQSYYYDASPGYQPQPQQQVLHQTPRSQGYSQEPEGSQQRHVVTVRQDAHPSQSNSPARQGEFLQPVEAAGFGSIQHRQPDVYAPRDFGDGAPQTQPSMQPRAAQEVGRQVLAQEEEQGTSGRQW